jgi:hypothetical protein
MEQLADKSEPRRNRRSPALDDSVLDVDASSLVALFHLATLPALSIT